MHSETSDNTSATPPAPPRRPRRPSVRGLARAYAKLGVNRDAVAALPAVGYLIDKLPGGTGEAIALLRGSADPIARAFLHAHDDPVLTARDRSLLPIEAFCVASSLAPNDLMALVVKEAIRQGAQLSAVIAATNHPAVVQKTVEMALTDLGTDDRLVLHKAVGFVAQPKGSQTIINVNPALGGAPPAPSTAILPTMDADIKQLSDSFNQKLLESSSVRPQSPALPQPDAAEPLEAAYEDAEPTDSAADEEEEGEMPI